MLLFVPHLSINKQVKDFLVVDFYEGGFDDEFGFSLAFLDLVKDFIDDSRNDSLFALGEDIAGGRAHRISFATLHSPYNYFQSAHMLGWLHYSLKNSHGLDP